MSSGEKAQKEQLEKLTEKHQQIQTGIKNLQQVEEGIFKNLEKAKKTQGSQTEQQELMNHITQLSSVRSQLFKDLKKEYDQTLKQTLGGGDKLGTQTAMLNNTEQQLNKLKGDLGKAQEVRANRKKMIEIGEYEFRRYGEHKELMKIIAFTALGIIISVALLKKEVVPKPFAQAGIVASGAIGSIFLIYQLIDMWYRNNIDYNKYNFGFWYEPGPPEAWPDKDAQKQPSRWETNKKGFSTILWGSQEKESGGEYSSAKEDTTDDSNTMAPGKDGPVSGPDPYEEQLFKLFSEKNCPEGARVRGYCTPPKAASSDDGGGIGGKGGKGGGSGKKDRPSLVGHDSEWQALNFDGSEGFLGSRAGAGINNSGVVVPFGGF